MAPLDPPRKILIIKWSAMGDVAIASAGIEDIYRAHPDAALHLSTLPPWDQLFVSDPRLAKVLSIDVRSRPQFSAMWRWLKEVASENVMTSSSTCRPPIDPGCCCPVYG